MASVFVGNYSLGRIGTPKDYSCGHYAGQGSVSKNGHCSGWSTKTAISIPPTRLRRVESSKRFANDDQILFYSWLFGVRWPGSALAHLLTGLHSLRVSRALLLDRGVDPCQARPKRWRASALAYVRDVRLRGKSLHKPKA